MLHSILINTRVVLANEFAETNATNSSILKLK
jgi:hypothetical protein